MCRISFLSSVVSVISIVEWIIIVLLFLRVSNVFACEVGIMNVKTILLSTVIMKVVLQRVSEGSVSVGDAVIGQIGRGVVLLVAFGQEENEDKLQWMVEKVRKLRIFGDSARPGSFMEQSLDDVSGEVLIVSQFTLYGNCRKGTRPSFTHSASAEDAARLYYRFVELWKETGLKVETGEFQAHMDVSLVNDGPVTLILDN
jgi:D-aminoacyl-tRNA deacylase